MKDYPKLIKKALKHFRKEGDADMLVWELEAILNEKQP